MGRTHGVHAEPTTFGLKLAGWAFALDRDRQRVARAVEGLRVGKLSGAVGQYAAIDPEVERIACERLGLEPAPSSTQILQRDRHAEVLSALALAASSLDRFATEIRHLARTEVREVEEPFASGQKGSSAMPHKRNPITAERICGLARIVRANAIVGLENVALWHERDISHCVGRARRHPRLVPRARLRARPIRVARRRARGAARADARRTSTRATGSSSASGSCSRSSRAGSNVTRRTGSSSATRCGPGTRSSTLRELVRGDAALAARVELDRVFDARRVHGRMSTSCSTGCGRSSRRVRPRSCRRTSKRHTSAAARCVSCTPSDRTGCSLVASDRISTYDVVLPTEIPDKGRVLTGLSAYWFARLAARRPEPRDRASGRWALARMRATRDAPGRVRRSRVPLRLGVGRLPGRRLGLRSRASGRAARVGALVARRSSRRRPRRRAGTTSTSPSRRPRRCAASERMQPPGARRSRSTRRRTRMPPVAASSSPTRSSSSGSTRTAS